MSRHKLRRCLLLLAVVLPLGAAATATPVPANGKLSTYFPDYSGKGMGDAMTGLDGVGSR